jgi:hypothetical protein
MDAYAGTPLLRKLGVGPGTRVLLFDAPLGFEAALAPLPDRASVSRAPAGAIAGTARVAILFARSVADLEAAFARAAASLDDKGTLWVAWPKRTSGVATDLSEAGVRSFGLGRGLVDFKVASIDQTWSGLRFARRSRSG